MIFSLHTLNAISMATTLNLKYFFSFLWVWYIGQMNNIETYMLYVFDIADILYSEIKDRNYDNYADYDYLIKVEIMKK